MTRRILLPAMLCAVALLCLPQDSWAFCGVYVGGEGKLYNDATQVVMMRGGTRTVLAMQNNYDGPAKDFAMVVPVPVVLKKQDVRTLSHGLFDKVDLMSSPRLVEYWERDPCQRYYPVKRSARRKSSKPGDVLSSDKGGAVKVEAQFEVGEYNVVILSATESNALETWLKQNKYNIPKGAAKVFKGYINQGMYFFVAKVDIKRVRTVEVHGKKRLMLSPLRFHYESKTFSLPVRLGLLNARGKQDLIVNILSKEGRFEVANRKNVTIPTNLIVDKKVKGQFASFYAALFDYTIKQNPRAVVTEYAWDASTCDPCPGPRLTHRDFETLGGDVIDKVVQKQTDSGLIQDASGRSINKPVVKRRRRRWRRRSGWVLTRLHARYGAKDLKTDLTFKLAKPIVGGRGTPEGKRGKLDEQGAKSSTVNNFQGRYIILHPWTKALVCKQPVRGRWGGRGAQGAKDVMYVDRKKKPRLKRLVKTKRAPGWRR